MEPNFLILLNFCVGEVVKIKLTEEEKRKSEEYEDFEDFMRKELEQEENGDVYYSFHKFTINEEDEP